MKLHIYLVQRGIMALLVFLGGLLLEGHQAQAQYFGRNKPRYRSFDFKVEKTPHFEFYHYLENDTLIQQLVKSAERWYQIHQYVLRDTIKFKNPLILYNNHADFQQTNAISGIISPGTGGVTEGLKNRVVLPLTETMAQTNHVLGHELVHAFQYNLVRTGDSTTLNSIRNLPLWMVEGLAEYMSIGNVDAHTAMWMRDAIQEDDLPTLEDMTKKMYKYFPYRYGQAFWSYVTGVWGDEAIKPLFTETAKWGYEAAIDTVLHISADSLSSLWHQALQKHFAPYEGKKDQPLAGKSLVTLESGDKMNVSPAVSPDGKYFTYLSEKNIFSLDLFLADANTGKVIRKLSSTVRNSQIDHFDFLESVGSWAPYGDKFAFVVYAKGKNNLAIVDVARPQKLEEFEIPGVASFSNPIWSPDGNTIVVSGLVEGQPDLYAYDLKSKKVRQLTNDLFAELKPSWSPDGQYLLFATDRTPNNENSVIPSYQIGIMETSSGRVEIIDVFPGANNLNPVFAPDGKAFYFLSDRDGFRNLYRYDLASNQVLQLTDYYTGISGITKFSPAISVAAQEGKILYSYYRKNGYELYAAYPDDFQAKEVDGQAVDFTAATLPPVQAGAKPRVVNYNLQAFEEVDAVSMDSVSRVPYQPKFKLDYISNTGLGVATSRYGTGLAGGVNMIFSDILGNNQLYGGLALNGEIYDFGGQFAYINQKNKLGWGVALSHIPYRYAWMGYEADTLNIDGDEVPVTNVSLFMQRIFEEQASVFAFLPLSTTKRFEFGGAMGRYSFRRDRYNNYYYGYNRIGQSREKLEAPDSYNLHQVNAAFVGDNSYFGIASPMAGGRYRFEVQRYFGALDFYSVLADYRKYFFIKPFSVGMRLMHYGRYGKDAGNERLYPMYLGYPYFIRGYESRSLNENIGEDGGVINQLSGNSILLGNLELRIPFTGPEKLSFIKSNLLFTELNLFVDGGLAYNTTLPFERNEGGELTFTEGREPVFSTGISTRINLFGQLVLEPYYAFPIIDGKLNGGSFGLNFTPGW